MSSYWSHCADVVERIQSKNLFNMLAKPRRYEQVKQKEKYLNYLWIDPIITKKYVNKINKLHKQIIYLIINYPHQFLIKYQEFYYENFLNNKYNNYYWYSLQSFLGIDIILNGNESWMIREHPIPCFLKIKNWNQIKNVINDTMSVYACQMLHISFALHTLLRHRIWCQIV